LCLEHSVAAVVADRAGRPAEARVERKRLEELAAKDVLERGAEDVLEDRGDDGVAAVRVIGWEPGSKRGSSSSRSRANSTRPGGRPDNSLSSVSGRTPAV
jgi:hypothetical protein